jgi:hypothetical protein
MKGRVLALMAVVAMATTPALGSPIEPGAIEVVDGDTIRAGGRTFRPSFARASAVEPT